MAADIFTQTVSYNTLVNYGGTVLTPTQAFNDPYPTTSTSTQTTYINRVWDTSVAGTDKNHYWENTGTAPDSSGADYDGPGTWGVTTSDYCVVSEYVN